MKTTDILVIIGISLTTVTLILGISFTSMNYKKQSTEKQLCEQQNGVYLYYKPNAICLKRESLIQLE